MNSNNEYLSQFIVFASQDTDDNFKHTLRAMYNLFIRQEHKTVIRPCEYIFKRGAKINTQCRTNVRNGRFCSKHIKYETVPPSREEKQFELDLNTIQDEDSDVDTDDYNEDGNEEGNEDGNEEGNEDGNEDVNEEGNEEDEDEFDEEWDLEDDTEVTVNEEFDEDEDYF